MQRRSKASDFRISTATRPVFYRTNETIEKLSQPKEAYEPVKPYLNQEFRGLLNADHSDVIQNCNEYNPAKHRP